MERKIFLSTLGISFIVAILSIVLITGTMFHFYENEQMEELHTELIYIAKGLSMSGDDYLDTLQEDERRITLVDTDGTVLFDNQVDAELMDNHLDREEIAEALETGTGKSVRYSATVTTQIIYYAVRLEDGRVLRLAVSRQNMFAMLLRVLVPALVIMGIAVALSVLISILLGKIKVQQDRIKEQEMLAEQMRREFTANVSHELKTPLTSISGFAELMMTNELPQEEVQDFSKTIYEEAQRLVALVADILNLSSLEDGHLTYEWERISLDEIVKTVVKRLNSAAEKKQISIEMQTIPGEFYGVSTVVEEMLYNLVDNAIKYNRVGGKVWIHMEDEKQALVVEVKDNGIGIPKDSLNRVFERFYRVDKSHSKAVGGTGLGLSIVKHGAVYHNATISLESELGKGTKIRLHFPKEQMNS